jgi:hypothetical protein
MQDVGRLERDDFLYHHGDAADIQHVVRLGKEWTTAFGPQWGLYKRGMYMRKGQLVLVGQMLLAGHSIRSVSFITGVHRATVRRMKVIIEDILDEPLTCPCGQPATHQGWCRHRLSNSPDRQEFLARMHSKQRHVAANAAA